jgi:hypothetical protein
MRKWGVRIGVAAMVVLITLAHLHVIEGDILLLALSAVMLLLSEQLHELAAEVKTETESIAQEVRKRFKILEGLIESLSPNLLNLLDCVSDLNKLLSLHGDANRIVIEYIGLDMVQAWNYFEPLFNSHPNFVNIDIKLLVLTDDLVKLGNVDEEVKTWAGNVNRMLVRMERDINHIANEPRNIHRKIKFEARKYASVPVIHGFRLIEPVNQCYVAFCR